MPWQKTLDYLTRAYKENDLIYLSGETMAARPFVAAQAKANNMVDGDEYLKVCFGLLAPRCTLYGTCELVLPRHCFISLVNDPHQQHPLTNHAPRRLRVLASSVWVQKHANASKKTATVMEIQYSKLHKLPAV